jgi:hypothetical protein
VAQIEERVLHQAGVQFAHALRQQAEQAVGDGFRGEDDLPEHGSGHDADLAAGQRRDVGRAADAVEGRELAEEGAPAHLAENHFLARLRAVEDAYLPGGQEVDVGGDVVVIDKHLVLVEAAPMAARLVDGQLDSRLLEERDGRQPSCRHASCPRRCSDLIDTPCKSWVKRSRPLARR